MFLEDFMIIIKRDKVHNYNERNKQERFTKEISINEKMK